MSKTKKVSEFINQLEHPFKKEIIAIREVILDASIQITEDIKWSAPSFAYKENMATVNLRSKKCVSLTFHKGAIINDTSGLLEGDSKEARVARFYSMDDVHNKRKNLMAVVQKWVEVMDTK